MGLGDVSNASHGERQEYFKQQLVKDDAPLTERIRAYERAHDMATAEMLDEIHTMLRIQMKVWTAR